MHLRKRLTQWHYCVKENRPVTEVEESNIVDLIKKKPIAGGRKRKPTLHMKLFNQKNQGE